MVDVKKQNRRLILQLLHEQNGISRKSLAEKLNLTTAAISVLVGELIKEEVVSVGKAISNNKNAGRKEFMLELSRTLYGIGIAILIDEIVCSVVDLYGRVIVEERLPYPNEMKNPHESLHYLGNNLLNMIERCEIPYEKIIGVGVSIRGFVNSKTCVSEDSLGLWDSPVEVRKILKEVLPYDIIVDNNVRALVCAQNYLEEGNATENALFVRSEYGIGGAILIDYNEYNGSHDHAGEIGHTQILGNNRLCQCGNRGCLETISSINGMIALMNECYSKKDTPKLYALTDGDKSKITIEIALKAVRLGDEKIANIFKTGVMAFANTLSNAIRLIDVKKIILYGKIFESEFYTNMLFDELLHYKISKNSLNSIDVSRYNCKLEAVAAPVLAIRNFIKSGAENNMSKRVSVNR